MILTNNITQVREVVNVEHSFSLDRLRPHLKTANRQHLIKVISKAQVQAFVGYKKDNPTILEAIELAREVEINMAMYWYLQVGFMQISAGGISVVTPKGQEAAASKDIRDSLRLYKRNGSMALDDLLSLMESTPGLFPQWVGSPQYQKYKGLLVSSVKSFEEHYKIGSSRQTFDALAPELHTVEYERLIPALGKDLLADLKSKESPSGIFYEVKSLVSKAAVLFCVSKTLGSGLFYHDISGIRLRFDLLEYEKKNLPSTSNHVLKEKEQREKEAQEFLKQALRFIKNNNGEFPSYTPPKTNSGHGFIKGKSIVAI